MKFITTIAVVLLVGCSTALATETHSTVSTDNAPRVCFKAQDWGPVSDKYRPCVRITHLYEDGSFQVKVMDADGTVRYTTGVSNLQD